MPSRKPRNGVSRLAQLIDQAGISGRSRRSSLTRWMRAHHADFAAMLRDRDPSWEQIATALAVMGLRDGDDKPPTAERARKTWWSVRRAQAATDARQAPTVPPLAAGEIAPGVQATRSPATTTATTTTTTLARPPISPPAPAGIPPLGSGATAPGPAGESEAMRRLRDSMQADKVPLPRPL